MASKNQGRLGRNYMGHHEEELGCLPKYNYSNGSGWRSHNKGRGVMATCTVRRKISGSRQKETRSI